MILLQRKSLPSRGAYTKGGMVFHAAFYDTFIKSAFTLVEILIVICIMLILFVVLVSRIDFSTDKARTTGAQSDLRSLQMAVHQIALEDGKIIDDINLLSQRLNKNLDSELII